MTDIDPKDIHLVEGTEEWSALYLNGKLYSVGDTYNRYEEIISLLGIGHEQSDDFLCGGLGRSDVALTLDDMYAYRNVRIQREERVRELRARADELAREAAQLEACDE